MKKVLLCVLVLLGLSLTSFALLPFGAKEKADNESVLPSVENTEKTDIDPALAQYLNALDMPTRQFGEIDSYIWMDKDFVTRILYPVSQIDELNSALASWVNQNSSYHHSRSVDCHKTGSRAELTVDYDSYIINQRIAAIELKGVYFNPTLGRSENIKASFNADIGTGKLLSLDDLLLTEGKDKLLEMLVTEANINTETEEDEEAFDYDSLLVNWLLKPEGLEITLPESQGSGVHLFPYEDLEEIITLLDPIELQTDVPEAAGAIEKSAQETPIEFDPRKPMLALTFDDGPGEHTDRLLDILSENNCKATFFVVGDMIEGNADTLQRMALDGHEIGGHSWNHRQLTSLNEEEINTQIMQTKAKIFEACGVNSNIIRPTYGSYNELLRTASGELGVALINWSVDSQDWKNKDEKSVYNALMTGARNGAVILCHDSNEATIDAMERAIPALIEQGYQLVTVSELFTGGGGALSAGTVYSNR